MVKLRRQWQGKHKLGEILGNYPYYNFSIGKSSSKYLNLNKIVKPTIQWEHWNYDPKREMMEPRRIVSYYDTCRS